MGEIKLFKAALISLLVLFLGSSFCFAALNYQETYHSQTGANKVLITVNSSIYSSIFSPYLTQYISDLEAENYNVTLMKYTSGTAQELKDYIKLITGLKGVIFVGNMPNAFFEVSNDFDQFGYFSFPIDLFYIDLDGVWQDTDNNDIYDTHTSGTGSLAPEIWLGRLTASPIMNPDMDEVALIKNYFRKNHSYRTGSRVVGQTGLAYPDDEFAEFWELLYLSCLYGDRLTVVNDPNLTTAADYSARLASGYEWVHVIAHFNETRHIFLEDDGTWANAVESSDIRAIDPKVYFYFLDACSNANYVADDNMGGNYIFSKTAGLAAMGSTKIKTASASSEFYPHLSSSERDNLGEASKKLWYVYDLGDFWTVCSVYGDTLLGDPTLSLDPPIPSIDYINPATSVEGQLVEFKGSGKISNGSIIGYSWRSSINGALSTDASFTSTSLSAGSQTIYFKVQDNLGRWSSEVSKTITVSVSSVPATPTGLTATLNGANVTLNWLDNAANETGYAIESSSDNVTFQPLITTLAANTKTYNVGVIYSKLYFRVFAYNQAGKSGNSNTVTVDPFPKAPTSLTATLVGANLTLNWLDNATNETGYAIESSIDNVVFQPLITTLAANTKTYNVGVIPRKLYFRVFAYNQAGKSANSNTVTANPTP